MDAFLLFAAIKCFGELGCFPVDAPFRSAQRPISVSPFAPRVINSSFLLYTRQRPRQPQIFSLDFLTNFTLFKPWRQSKMIIHGFRENGFTKQWIKDMVNELLDKDDFNVFVVDWGSGAQMPYYQAVANARVVGRIIARFIHLLKINFNATAESFHLIGHSLGAHVAGYAGHGTTRLGRISGLDPAKPYFEGTDQIVRLDPSDANLVDVIHTATESIWRGGMGMATPCGHLDFYPNYGKTQPGCNGPLMTSVLKKKQNFIFGMGNWFACSHERAYILFTESINNRFIAISCRSGSDFRVGQCFGCGRFGQNCALMGFDADKTAKRIKRRKYFLLTSSKSPHNKLQNRIILYIRKWSGHSGTFDLEMQLNPTTKIPIKLNTKLINDYKISIIFPSNSIKEPQINLKWHPDRSIRINPFTYFNGDNPEMCVRNIVVEHINSDKEIFKWKLKPKNICTTENDQKFASD